MVVFIIFAAIIVMTANTTSTTTRLSNWTHPLILTGFCICSLFVLYGIGSSEEEDHSILSAVIMREKKETKPYINTSRNLIPRYNGPTDSERTAEQEALRQSILNSRPRTGLHGPFGPWLAIPEIAEPAQQLGQACRYGTSLNRQESELIILLTGAKYESATEFDIHVGEALSAGWTMTLIEAIPRGRDFSVSTVRTNVLPVLNTQKEQSIALFAAELLETNTVSNETYNSTKHAVDDKDSVLVEITSIVGYYAYVCLTLNVFRIPSY
eukprot:scaffold956_cov97-Cylindrotheca_fusiformis.AAC.6